MQDGRKHTPQNFGGEPVWRVTLSQPATTSWCASTRTASASLRFAPHERDLEQGLLAHIRDFLLELGVGFAFVGSQYHLEVGGEDFYIDLLFCHLRLRTFVVIDLKVVDFEPEFAGKMNFYLAAVDNLLRHAGDQPSIGIIVCKT
ncbi:MAG TPA: PDDEXK nuclease domain-containing protein [Ktedonobacterales bacterium]|nr:PDDEXK nuclease domain-containing protein [Ktedonobacterales bacterium]